MHNYLFKNKSLKSMQGGQPAPFEIIKAVLLAVRVIVDRKTLEKKVKKSEIPADVDYFIKLTKDFEDTYKPIKELDPETLNDLLIECGHENSVFYQVDDK